MAALGLDVGVDPTRNGRISATSVVLVDHGGTLAVCPIRAMRSVSPARVATANVFPARLRSCKCSLAGPIAAVAYDHPAARFKFLRPLPRSAACHSLIIDADSLPPGAPPRCGTICLSSSQEYRSTVRGRRPGR
jgi:hypothetical protein